VSLQIGIPLFIGAAVLQAGLLPHLRVFGGQPDLIVILVIVWSALDTDREGLVWAFVGGLFIDLFSGVPLGISSVALLPVAFLVTLTESNFYRNNLLLTLPLAAVGAAVYHVLYLILLRFLADYPVVWAESLWYVTLPSVLFDVILIIPVLRLLMRWYDRFHPRQIRL
jgi:rod shape-determining protein MreD